jgi:hypothetical protein
MTVLALIGPKALYLLFAWLISAAVGSIITARKGYGERLGLGFGLILSVVGLLIVIFLPSRPGSKWRVEGWYPPNWWPRRGRQPAPEIAPAPEDWPPSALTPPGE